MAASYGRFIREVTNNWLKDFKRKLTGLNFDRSAAAEDLYNVTDAATGAYNITVSKSEYMPKLKHLHNLQVALLIKELEPVCFISCGKTGEEFMVQCMNGYPRIKDTSDSFYRRQLFIPFDKCFTGRARKYIKDDYLSRPEVLEYVLFKVLKA